MSVFSRLGVWPYFVIQPIFHWLPSQRGCVISGGEALLRLQDSNFQPYPLGLFFENVSQERAFEELDLHMIKVVLGWMSKSTITRLIKQLGIVINVNITPYSLEKGLVFKTIKALTAKNPELCFNLCLELVESFDLSNIYLLANELEKIRGLGVKISLDDFGTGFMGDKQFLYFQPDQVKIDYSIITELGVDELKTKFTLDYVNYANKQGVAVVAEGVEHIHILHQAQSIGIRHYQGYLFSRELVATEFIDLARLITPQNPVIHTA